MASIVRETVARTDDARSLLGDLFGSEADLLPDVEHHILRAQVHPMFVDVSRATVVLDYICRPAARARSAPGVLKQVAKVCPIDGGNPHQDPGVIEIVVGDVKSFGLRFHPHDALARVDLHDQ